MRTNNNNSSETGENVDTPLIQKSSKYRFSFYHLSAFLLTFISYAMLHAARKVFSNVKSTMAEEWSAVENETINPIKPDELWNQTRLFQSPEDATVFLGVLDAAFMFSYSTGLFISGIIGDRFDLRKVLCFGMVATAIVNFLFGVLSEWLHIYSVPWYVVFWILNGLAQSTGWPCVVAIMGNWFGKEGRGLIFGIWSACASVGNIFGAVLAATFLKYGYEYAFLVCATLLIACAIICFFAIIPSPNDINIKHENKPETNQETTATTVNDNETGEETLVLVKPQEIPSNKPITFFRALVLPGVAMYSLCYACLKLVNYSFFFWLPFYLHQKFNWQESDADILSTLYDVGGIIGGIVGGILSDMAGLRSIVVVPKLLIAIPILFIFSNLSNNKAINGVVMTVTGIFIGGPANMISAAITADLGRQEVLAASDQALSTVTGIVDGTGSFGAAIGQVLIPIIEKRLQWAFVFYFFVLMTFITCLCILPLFIRESKIAIGKIKDRFSAYRQRSYDAI